MVFKWLAEAHLEPIIESFIRYEFVCLACLADPIYQYADGSQTDRTNRHAIAGSPRAAACNPRADESLSEGARQQQSGGHVFRRGVGVSLANLFINHLATR